MDAIKRAVSPKSPRYAEEVTAVEVKNTPLTTYICSRLNGENLRLFATLFAEAIRNDRHAEVIVFEQVHKFLGYTRYDSAVKQLRKLFPGIQSTLPFLSSAEGQNLRFVAEVSSGARGPSKDSYLISVRQFETLMLAAKTDEGARAREMMLDVKDAVQDYMKMEMEAEASARRVANERLTIGEGKLAELEAVQSKLQATIDSQEKREDKKEARKKQQKLPLETAYLMSNNPGGQGPFKCGMTEKEAKQRAKAMQTGNHEPVIVVAAIPCMNAELIEKVMHQIFYDYRTNDRLEWFDAPLDSMKSTLSFVIES